MWWLAAGWAQEAEDLEDIEEITVTGTRTAHALGDEPVATEVIDREAIERSGATSAADLLERVAGIQVDHGVFGTPLSMQGLDPDHVLVLVDGQRMIGRLEGNLDLTRISAGRIERIEIVKGPGSTLYGSDAMGGVINIVTRDPDAAGVALDLRGGGFGTVDAVGTLTGKARSLGSHTTLGFHNDEGYDLAPRDLATDGAAFDELEGSQKLVWDATDDWELTGEGTYLTRGSLGIDLTETGARFDRNNRIEDARSSLSSRWVATEASTVTVTALATVYRNQLFYDQVLSNREDDYEDSRQTVGELEAQYDVVAGTHVVTVGSEVFREWLITPRLAGGSGSRTAFALYAQDEWKLARGDLSLLPGVRLDVDSVFGVVPAPRLAAAVFAGEDVVIRASYGLGFRTPDFKERFLEFENPAAGYVVEGNPDLRPERSLGGTLGVEYDPRTPSGRATGDPRSERFHASVQAFRNDLWDLIDFEEVDPDGFSATQRFTYGNVARAWTLGADANVAVTPIEPLTLRTGAQALATRNLETGEPLPNRAPFSGTFGTTVREERTRLSWDVGGTWSAARTNPAPSPCRRVDPFALLDTRLGWALADGTELYAGGENLLGAGDAECNQLKPLWLYVGLKASLGGA